jgi:UDPglucose--hexose-1-phosphate uridylyltransferase
MRRRCVKRVRFFKSILLSYELTKADSTHSIAYELLRAQPVSGRCYVLTYSANHHFSMSDMTRQEVCSIVEAWTRVYARYLPLDNPLRKSLTKIITPDPNFEDAPCLNLSHLKYMQIFDNNRETVGCTNTHPHGQIWVTSSMPDEPRIESAQLCKYHQEHYGRHLLEDYVQLELNKEERIVWQNDGFLVVCPWWAIWPFEVLLLPKRQVRALVDFNKTERFQFAEAILQITRIYDNLFGSTFPYSTYLRPPAAVESQDL